MASWVKSLLYWYEQSKREMPWRSNPLPYHVWISEMMLQQTQVKTVIPYFNRFIERFPTVQVLAESDLQDVLKEWEGLGYYSRARYLHQAAIIIHETFNGRIPSDYKQLQTLPGIGPYCAAAITSISFGYPVPVVDGNVLRVFTRFWGMYDDIRQSKVRLVIFHQLMSYISLVSPSDFNQAIMECGALVCTPTQPTCSQCPLHNDCFAYAHNKQTELPVKSKLRPVPHYTIVVGLIIKDRQILIAKRKTTQMLGGLWEFPGGKPHPSETHIEALSREILEEVDLVVNVTDLCRTIKHAYSHFKITLHAYWCDYVSGEAVPHCSDEVKWVDLDTLDLYPFPKVNSKLFNDIKKLPCRSMEV